jgi:hypothetical protein
MEVLTDKSYSEHTLLTIVPPIVQALQGRLKLKPIYLLECRTMLAQIAFGLLRIPLKPKYENRSSQ